MNFSLIPQTYRQCPLVWSPNLDAETGLFLVRHPHDQVEMSASIYLELVKLRLECLLLERLEHQEQSRQELHAWMVQQLHQTTRQTEFPRQTSDLWVWTSEWAEAWLEHNDLFFPKLNQKTQITTFDFPLPIPPMSQEVQLQLSEWHDETMLEEWIYELSWEPQ